MGSPWSTVVGVVGHVRHTGLDDDSQPQVYWNYPQRTQERMMLLAVFASIALVLAGIGAYGVIAYGVSQRVREFGVRMALGARRRDVTAMVLRRGGLLFALGAATGLVLATVSVHLRSSLVYGVAPRDVPSFFLSTLILFVVSMVACYVPARRAARVEPSIALRSE